MRPLRIALLQPTYWPEVRRGSERLAHDLALALTGAGHNVTIITSHAGPSARSEEEGFTVERLRRPPELRRQQWYEYHVGNIPRVFRRLTRGGFDIAHAQFNAEAYAASKARRWGGPPYVFSFHGIPTREHLVERRYRLEMMRSAVSGAAAVTTLSEAARERFQSYFPVEVRVLPGGVVPSAFDSHGGRAPVPTVACLASLTAPHKRGKQLLEAFEELRAARPEAELELVRTPDPFMSVDPLRNAELGALPEGSRWVDAESTEDLATVLSRAWATVLPSINEAFGLVVLESLAAGRPVAAARSGGIPELLGDKRIGRLFEPDDASDTAQAIEAVLDLSTEPGTPEACRAAVAPFEWDRIVERYERLYAEVLSDRG